MTGERVVRRLAAILAADVVGYSRLMGRDENGTLARLKAHRTERLEPVLGRHGGRLVKLTGDGALIEFPSAVDALSAAIEFQEAMTETNKGLPEETAIVFRIGLHLGDLIVEGDDLYGDGVNVAARLEAEAPPGGIVVSRAVREAVDGRLKAKLHALGELSLKNIERPICAFRVEWEAADWNATAAAVPMAVKDQPTAPVPTTPALALPDKPSIAVLPFQNMSGDPEQEYFADGMVEDIITALSRLRGFFVIARNSSFSYKGKSPDIRQVGRELGVRYVIEGSVRKVGNRIRITAQLINVVDGSHLWAERYDREVSDIFAVQDEITAGVVASLEPQLYEAENIKAKHKSPADLDAWGCVVRSISLFSLYTPLSLQTAQHLLEFALERDPQYARALALLVLVRGTMAFNGWEDRSPGPVIGDLVQKAMSLDFDDPWVQLAAGQQAAMSRRPDEAIGCLTKALALNPNFALAQSVLALALAAIGRSDEAIDLANRALRQSPRDPLKHLFLVRLATAYFSGGRYAEAAACAQESTRMRPELISAHRVLVSAYVLAGNLEGARTASEVWQKVQPSVTIAWIDAHSALGPELRSRLMEALRSIGIPE